MHDVPGIWEQTPNGPKLNHQILAGWETAGVEVDTGEYQEFFVTPSGIFPPNYSFLKKEHHAGNATD